MKTTSFSASHTCTITNSKRSIRLGLGAATWVLCLGIWCFSPARVAAQQTGVHQFNSITALLDRTIALELWGGVPAAFKPYFDLYLVETSTDLSDWAPLATLLRTNASSKALIYIDPDSSGLPHRFYRMPTNQLITPLPIPSGPFAAGTIERELTDPARTNRYGISTNSAFMATFWYPAQAQAGQLPGPYDEPKLASYFPFWHALTNVIPYFVADAFPGALVATNDNTYPVIIYSHGWTDCIGAIGIPKGVRGENAALATELASRGFIVVAIDHADSGASALQEQTMIVRGPPLQMAQAETAMQSRLQDVAFLLGQLSRLNQTDPVLASHLDLEHIGAVGWCWGGGTALKACRNDAQIKAAVWLDGFLDPQDDLLSTGLQKPFLAMNSPVSTTYAIPQSQTLFGKTTNTAYLLQILNTQHATLMDEAWIVEHSDASRLAGRAKSACTVSFFNKLFKNQDDHLLDAPTNTFSNIVQFRKKP